MFKALKKLVSQILGIFGSVKPQVPEIIEPKILSAHEVLDQYMGINEEQNADIIDMKWQEYGRPKYNHETYWCGLAIAIAEVESGYLEMDELPEKYEASRKWLVDYPVAKYDMITDVDDLQDGDLVVSWRVQKDSWQGHITVFSGWATERTQLKSGRYKYFKGKGGNQRDAFSVKDCLASRFLGALRRKA